MSWATVNLISAARVKEEAGLAKGVEDRKLDRSIRHDAQPALQEILGETLYAMVEAASPVTDATLGGDTGLQTLYNEHIVFFLTFKTVECAMEEMWGEPDRNGVFQKSGQDYAPVDGRLLSTLQGRPRSRSENHAGEMIRYLKNLASTDPIRVAYDTCVKDEARTAEIKTTGRISTRISPWQFPDGHIPHKHRYRDGC